MSTTTTGKDQLTKIANRRAALQAQVSASEDAAAEMAQLKFQEFGILREAAKEQMDKAQTIYALVNQAMRNGGVIKINLFVHEASQEKGTSMEVDLSNTTLGNEHELIKQRETAVERVCTVLASVAGAKLRNLEQDPEYTNEVHRFANGG